MIAVLPYQKLVAGYPLSQQYTRGFFFFLYSTPNSHFVLSFFFISARLMGGEYLVLSCISLITNEIKHFSFVC